MTIFISLSPLLFSPNPNAIPKANLAHNLPTTLIGHNPHNLFCYSAFHSIISDVQSCQNKVNPTPVLRLARFSSSFLFPPAWKHSRRSAGLSLSQAHTTITGLKASLFVNLHPQKASSQLRYQPLPSHWHNTSPKLPSLLTAGSRNERAEAKDNTLFSQHC